MKKRRNRNTGQSQLLISILILSLISVAVIATNSSLNVSETNTSESLPVQEQEVAPTQLEVVIDSPGKITRGEIIEVKATVTNTGSTEAKNVVLTWQLPHEFEIVSGSQTENCGDLEPNASYESTITIQTSIHAELGNNEIKIVVNYE